VLPGHEVSAVAVDRVELQPPRAAATSSRAADTRNLRARLGKEPELERDMTGTPFTSDANLSRYETRRP
jgi:hypothetical protein